MDHDHDTSKLLLKQGEYRKLYSSILQNHRGALQPQPDESSAGNNGNNDDFDDEARVLHQIFRTEAKNFAVGIGAAAVTLATFRFARSRHAASAVFGTAKAKVMHDAEMEGKRIGTDDFQKSFANVVEGMFSLYMGYRCYDYASHRSKDSMNAIAELPLCKGRSRVAEALCPEWIETTTTKIPAPFWKAVADHQLREERTWAAIQQFSINCERRLAAERSIRNKSLVPEGEPIVLPNCVSTARATDTAPIPTTL